MRGVAALETKAASQLCTNATDGAPPLGERKVDSDRASAPLRWQPRG